MPKNILLGSHLKIFLVNLSLLGVGLVILELLFGAWLDPFAKLKHLNLIRGTTISYDANHLYETKGKRGLYQRDKYGLRGVYTHTHSIDILTVGGSTTDQRYIPEGATWQDVLQNDFADVGKKIAIANAGVDGQTTYGHIKNFEWWFPFIPDLKAKYFLFYVGVNDHIKEAGNPFDDLVKQDVKLSLKEIIKERSALYYLYRTLRGIYQANEYQLGHHHLPKDFTSLRWTSVPLLTDHEQIVSERLKSYENRLRVLHKKVRQMNATPIFVTQSRRSYREKGGSIEGVARPMKYFDQKMNGVDQYIFIRLFNQKTLDICREIKGICVDLANELKFEEGDFYDFSHTTPKGSEKIGHYLFEVLRNQIV